MSVEAGATYESKSETEAQATDPAFVKMWLDALNLADEEEKDWRKTAEEVNEVYRGKKKSKGRNFNILHSNIETLCPALYNSTPVPDVRRRFSDPDPIAKVVCDILERSVSFAIDSYDFDSLMKAVVRDGELAGRGVPRVRYIPTFDDTGNVVYEEATCEYVPWRYFRRGPGRTWNDVPWVAFGDFLTRESLRDLCGDMADKNGKLVADEVPLNYTAEKRDGKKKAGVEENGIFRRALVWQIWDREKREVISICPDYEDSALAIVPDPLELEQFFPVPRPYQPILTTDSLVPVTPYEIYEDHVLELNEVTARIAKLVKQLRPRGGYASGQSNDLKAIAEADDGELVPLMGTEHLVSEGGLERAIVWFPLQPVVAALNQLVEHRERIKQVIYEVTGIADILRGSTNPNETLGAQQLKAQWGSLRIQDRQAEVARVSRDLIELKAEIIANKFSWETLVQMTGINLPSAQEKQAAQAQMAQMQQQAQAAQQAGQPSPPIQVPPDVQKLIDSPTREEVEQVLRSDVTRRYRVDIESDSTIRGDLARNQQIMTQFLQGTAQYAQAMGPIMMQMPKATPAALKLFGAFARQFKLGKQAEDALDQLVEAAEQGGLDAQQNKPDPKLEADKAKAEAMIKKSQMDMQRDERKHSMDMQRMDREEMRDEHDLAMEQQRMTMGLPPASMMRNGGMGMK